MGFRRPNTEHELLAEAFQKVFDIIKRRVNPRSVTVLIHLRSHF